LLVEIEVASQGLQFRQEADQILKAAAKTVHGPGSDHVDLSTGGILRQPIEVGTLVPAL